MQELTERLESLVAEAAEALDHILAAGALTTDLRATVERMQAACADEHPTILSLAIIAACARQLVDASVHLTLAR